MKIIKQLFWIFLFSFLGEFISIISPIAVPGSVIGMVLLFLALHYGLIELKQVDTAGTWLTDNMAVLFIPPGVGLMTNFDVIGGVWWQLLIVILGSTAAMIAFVGLTVQLIKKRSEQKRAQHHPKERVSMKGESVNG